MAGDIRNIIEIMKNDFKSAFSNPIVTIVLIGIIVLPSLYGLLNIEACWDPYGNTGDVQFAIANLDNGSTFQNETINIGNELVKELKDNDKFDWTFVTEKELRDGVYNGKYYAGIVIPRNLTENVLSITTDNPKQAKLEYIPNIKSNPVATKLTDSGANAVYNTLNSKIIQVINLAAFDKLGELQEGLAAGAGQLAGGGTLLQAGADQVSDGASQVSSGTGQVQDGASQVQSGASQVTSNVGKIEEGASQVEQGSSAVKDGASQVEKGSEELESAVDPSLIPEGPIKEYVEGSGELAKGSSQVAGGASQLADGSVSLAKGSSKLATGSGKVADGASQVAGGSVELAEGSLALAAGAELLSTSAAQALFTAAGSLASSASTLGQITGINETILGDYFFAPVSLDRHEVFSVPNYGSNVAPFYIVLSMWVGGIITCAMLKPGVAKGTKYTPREMYFGKLGIFLILSILQACVTLGGTFAMGIYIANAPLYILSGILVSAVFMILIYSLVSAMGEVGKAVAVVLLVFQISGTGGIYPVQIMGRVFQALHPYLPMTYAITLMREAQLGLVWSNYQPALIILIAIGIITVIILLILKTKADAATHYFESRLEDSGLF